MCKYLTNHAEIQRRGGQPTSDSDFVVVACASCGHQYLYDEELLQLYIDPEDLSVRYLNGGKEWPNCSGCSAAHWDFSELDAESHEVAKGPWAWAR